MPKTKIPFSITPVGSRLRKGLLIAASATVILLAIGLVFFFLQPVPHTTDFLSGQEVRFDGWWIKPVNGPACVFFSDESLTELANRVEGYSNRWTNYRTTQGPSGLLIDRQTSDGKMTHACFIRIPELVFGQPAYWFHNFSATFRSSDGTKTLSIPLPYHMMATSSVLNPYGGDLSFGTRYAAFASKKEFISFYQDWRAILI